MHISMLLYVYTETVRTIRDVKNAHRELLLYIAIILTMTNEVQAGFHNLQWGREPSPTNISSTTSGVLRYISDFPDARAAGARQEPRVARDSDGGSNEFVSTCTFCPSRLLVRRRLSNEAPRHWRRWDIISPQTTLQPTASDNYAAAQLDLCLKDCWPRWSVRQVGLYSHTQARPLVLKAV